MIAVVDYCKGNLKSVERGLRAVGGDAHITADPEVIAKADAIVLPGVGSFSDAVSFMRSSGQMEAVRSAIERGVPFLGICLGQQLLFAEGVEGASVEEPEQGIGMLAGCCDKIPAQDENGAAYKVPHVGWNSVQFDPETAGALFNNIAPGEYFYFTHSYKVPETEAAIAHTTHSVTFPSAVRFGEKAYGVQFHPEKSSDAGAQLLKNFVQLIAADE